MYTEYKQLRLRTFVAEILKIFLNIKNIQPQPKNLFRRSERKQERTHIRRSCCQFYKTVMAFLEKLQEYQNKYSPHI